MRRWTPNPNLRKEVKTCVTELYTTDCDMSDSDLTTHKTKKFAEEDDREDGVDCITQPVLYC
jgi:hypothetical protein